MELKNIAASHKTEEEFNGIWYLTISTLEQRFFDFKQKITVAFQQTKDIKTEGDLTKVIEYKHYEELEREKSYLFKELEELKKENIKLKFST